MRYALITGAAALSLSALFVLASAPVGQAQDWPWCADLAGDEGGGGTNCGFASWRQCQIYISGIGGWCYPNPHYRGEPAPRRRQRQRQ
jgi:hypothetical protein